MSDDVCFVLFFWAVRIWMPIYFVSGRIWAAISVVGKGFIRFVHSFIHKEVLEATVYVKSNPDRDGPTVRRQMIISGLQCIDTGDAKGQSNEYDFQRLV